MIGPWSDILCSPSKARHTSLPGYFSARVVFAPAACVHIGHLRYQKTAPLLNTPITYESYQVLWRKAGRTVKSAPPRARTLCLPKRSRKKGALRAAKPVRLS